MLNAVVLAVDTAPQRLGGHTAGGVVPTNIVEWRTADSKWPRTGNGSRSSCLEPSITTNTLVTAWRSHSKP